MGVIVWALSSSSDAVRLPRVSTAAHAAGPAAGAAPAHTSPRRSASRPRPLAPAPRADDAGSRRPAPGPRRPAPAHRRRRLSAPRARPPHADDGRAPRRWVSAAAPLRLLDLRPLQLARPPAVRTPSTTSSPATPAHRRLLNTCAGTLLLLLDRFWCCPSPKEFGQIDCGMRIGCQLLGW